MTGAENNWTFVIAAFAATWMVVIGYAIRVHVALARARKEHDVAMSHPEHRA